MDSKIPKRLEYSKKFKWCFRCLGEGHSGQSWFTTYLSMCIKWLLRGSSQITAQTSSKQKV